MDFTEVVSARACPQIMLVCNQFQDPAGVNALLERLRSSQAWQQAVSSGRPDQAIPEPSTSGIASNVETTPSASTSTTGSQPPSTVASLLSQLNATASSHYESHSHHVGPPFISQDASSYSGAAFQTSADPPQGSSSFNAPLPSSARKLDLRSCTFQQALPHLARLSGDADFVSAIARVRLPPTSLRAWELTSVCCR